MLAPVDLNLPRRSFIKHFTIATAWSLVPERIWKAKVLAEIQPVTDPNTAVFRLNVSEYPALAKDFGSVRISTSGVVGTNSSSIFPVIMVNRAPGNQFYALDAACTHEGCILPTFNAAARRVECLCHGSRFSVDGGLLRGPAGEGLLKYNSFFDGANTLRIEVPDRGFSVTYSKIQSTPGRVGLQFLAFENIQYEVNTRGSLAETWRSIPFALTPGGAADATLFKGQDDFATLYVPVREDFGFLAVAMRLRQV